MLVEYDPGFCRLLEARFARRRVIQGDAYDLPRTLAEFAGEPIAAVVSSLPLLNQPPQRREKLIDDAFALMGPGGVFVQFTYGLQSPIPRDVLRRPLFRAPQRGRSGSTCRRRASGPIASMRGGAAGG